LYAQENIHLRAQSYKFFGLTNAKRNGSSITKEILLEIAITFIRSGRQLLFNTAHYHLENLFSLHLLHSSLLHLSPVRTDLSTGAKSVA
jgi:hypothetical protein